METLGPSINTLLQIGGAVGGGLRFLTNPLGNAMAMDFKDAMGGGGFVGTQRTNVFINQGGEAYIREPDGNMKFDGMYSPDIHGPIFPGMGLVQRNNDMKVATHDKPGIGRNSPPASSGDNLAPDWLIDYMNRKDENLLQIQDRLKRA